MSDCRRVIGAVAAIWLTSLGLAVAQRGGTFTGSRDHPAIGYSTATMHDPVARLSTQIESGQTRLRFDTDHGYLQSVLDALHIPRELQVVVFSGTSKQAERISPKNPRALYFNESTAVGWVRGADELEIMGVDPERGAVFYTLDQRATDRPAFRRDDASCLMCHLTWDTRGVPGLVVMSVFSIPNDPYGYASGSYSDQRTPFSERWGGWFVTAPAATIRHLGNDIDLARANRQPTARWSTELGDPVDARTLLTPRSEAVALMVLEHQATMTNLITRTGWEARVAAADRAVPAGRGGDRTRPATDRMADAVTELVDYLLFVDESPLTGSLTVSSELATAFAAAGPRDHRGRSLREFDLRSRLMRYPCSYLIYADAFDQMPQLARDAVYERLWKILSGDLRERPYDRLSRDDRLAIVEILKDTKKGLPPVFDAAAVR